MLVTGLGENLQADNVFIFTISSNFVGYLSDVYGGGEVHTCIFVPSSTFWRKYMYFF